MADVSGVENLDSDFNGATSLAGIQSAVDNLNTAKQEKGSGVTGNIPTFGSSNVLGDSGLTPPASTIVGRADVQTLTNKTLTSPAITNPSTTGTDSGTETLTNKTIAGGSNTISGITEAMQTLADNTTNNASSSAHGYLPKLPNDATKYLDGTGNFSTIVPSSVMSASANLKTSDNASVNQLSGTYTLAKDIICRFMGAMSVSFQLYSGNGIATAFGRIYQNGIAVGTEQSTTATSGSPATFTQTISNIAIGDHIQLYLHSNGSINATGLNFQLSYDLAASSADIVVT